MGLAGLEPAASRLSVDNPESPRPARAGVVHGPGKRSAPELQAPPPLHDLLRSNALGTPGGIRTRGLRTPLSIVLRPARGGRGAGDAFVRRSTRPSYGHSDVRSSLFRTLALSHCCPPPAGVTDGARTRASGVTVRRSVQLSYGLHVPGVLPRPAGPPRPLRGVALFHTFRDCERPAGPVVIRHPAYSDLLSGSRAGGKRKIAPPGISRGRGDTGRSRCRLVESAPRGVRHGPPALVLSVPPNLAGAAECSFAYGCRTDGVRRVPTCHPSRRRDSPAVGARTTAAYRAGPLGPPAWLRSRRGGETASHTLRVVRYRARRDGPRRVQNKKGAAFSMSPLHDPIVVRGRPDRPP